MAKDIKIPQIAEGVESATVSEVLISEGDEIEKDDALITVESDKASVDIPSPESGTVKSIEVSEGDEVKVGDVILSLETSEEEDEEEEDTAEEKDKSDQKEESDSKEDEEEKKSDKKEDAKDEEEGDEEETDSSKKEDKSTEDEDEEEKTESAKTEEEDTEEKDKSEDEDQEEQEDVEEDKVDDEDQDKKAEKEKSESSEAEEKKSDEKKEGEELKEEKDKGEKEDKTEESKDGEKPSEEKKKKGPKEEVAAAPEVRRLARELGVDIEEVQGSEQDGRITKADVKAHVKEVKSQDGTSSLSLPDFSKWGETETKSFSGIRSATAKNTASSWQNIPHVFQFDEADISEIEEYIAEHKEDAEKADVKITITSVLTKISALALQKFPKFNASIDVENQEMILKKYVNIGIAVDTEKGLLVPVIKDADKKSIIEISDEITELAEKARAGKLSPEEMKGGNFTISNLGGIGGTNFTPIILHPQVAILGVSRSTKKPVYTKGKFEPREILPLSVSYDHRLIDGAEGVRFLKWIVQALEDPYAALLGV